MEVNVVNVQPLPMFFLFYLSCSDLLSYPSLLHVLPLNNFCNNSWILFETWLLFTTFVLVSGYSLSLGCCSNSSV
jgi:hypothetical protein